MFLPGEEGLGIVFTAQTMGRLKLWVTWVISWAGTEVPHGSLCWGWMCWHWVRDESHLRKVTSGFSAAAECLRGAPGLEHWGDERWQNWQSMSRLNWLNLKWQQNPLSVSLGSPTAHHLESATWTLLSMILQFISRSFLCMPSWY